MFRTVVDFDPVGWSSRQGIVPNAGRRLVPQRCLKFHHLKKQAIAFVLLLTQLLRDVIDSFH